MQRYWIWTLLPLLAAAGSARGETRRAVFEGAGTELTWALKDLDPGLPADWSPFQFLVLELRLSSPQRFDLRIHDAGGIRSVRLAPVPGAWIRAAVPLNFLDPGGALGQRSGVGTQQGPADDVHQPQRHARRAEIGQRDRRRDGQPDWRAVARNPRRPLDQRGSRRRPAGSETAGRPVRPVDGRRLAGQGDQPGAVAGRLGRRGKGAREGGFRLLPLRRLRGLESQSHRFLPRREDRRQVVVCGSRRPPLPLAGRRFHGRFGGDFHPGARAVVRRAAAGGHQRRTWRRPRRIESSTPGTWCAASARTGSRSGST